MTPLRVRGFLNRTKVRCVHSNERKCAKSQEGRSIAARYPKSMTRMNSPARYEKLRVSVNVYKERVGPLVVSCCCSLMIIYLSAAIKTAAELAKPHFSRNSLLRDRAIRTTSSKPFTVRVIGIERARARAREYCAGCNKEK